MLYNSAYWHQKARSSRWIGSVSTFGWILHCTL